MSTEIKKIKELTKYLNECRDQYYNYSNSIITDAQYDNLFDELKVLEEKNNFSLSNSPISTVGYSVVSNLPKVTHITPLKSLDKTKSIDEINKWMKGKDTLLMLKLDGLTIELDYQNGRLVEASTRGNGEIGELVTHTVKTFKNVPLTIPFKGKLRISGEAIIHWNSFKLINGNLPQDEKYKHPRNLASGSVRQLDSNISAKRNIFFYAFNVLECSDELFDSKMDNLKQLSYWGFSAVPNLKINVPINNDIVTKLQKMAEERNLPIDGLVFAYDDVQYASSLGETSHHPLHSIAFKFEDETATTILRAIEWSVGRTGQITPVAIFDTVELDGTEVSRASIHNLTIMRNLKLGIGDTIEVYKANMIIPQILRNLTQSDTIIVPDECPICGGETEQITLNKSTVLMCTSADCPSQRLARFSHFVSREAMNIDGLSESTLEKFLNKGFIRTFADIYKLDNHKDDIVKMEGFGEKSYAKLASAIEKSKNTRLNNYLYAMGIPNIGKSSSKSLAEYFDYDIVKFCDALRNKFDFTQLKDMGSVANDSLYQWWSNYRENLLRDGLGLILNFEIPKAKNHVVTDSVFCGKKVYATGSFANYKKEEIVSLLESFGAVYMSGYAKSLDYLIIGSIKGSGKEDKAKKDNDASKDHKIIILTEEKFREMIK